MKSFRVALALYTIRDAVEEEGFEAILPKVSEMGYAGIEFASYFGNDAGELRELAKKYSLEIVSSHIPYRDMLDDLPGVISYSKELGLPFAAIPILPEGMRPGDTGNAGVIDKIREIATEFKNAGIQLMYHNHDMEFKKNADGVFWLDELMDAVDADLLKPEVDVYWAMIAGVNPSQYILRYQNRLPVLHLKDGASMTPRDFTEIGSGIQDWEDIFDSADKIGTQWVVVEQDQHKQTSSLVSAQISRNYLSGLGL